MSKLIVGLGNPGKKYENTPHNLGREVVEYLVQKLSFSAFQNKKNLSAAISTKNIIGEKIILAFPLTFVNQSGITIKNLKNFFKIDQEDIWIVHDDLDIDWGKIKISKNRGSAGHHGIESIIQFLKTKNFWRVRIGISQENLLLSPEIYVLKKIAKNKQKEKEEIIKKAAEIIINQARLII